MQRYSLMWFYYNTARKGFKIDGKTKGRQDIFLAPQFDDGFPAQTASSFARFLAKCFLFLQNRSKIL